MDKVAQQTEVLKVNVKTKRVNQGVVKEIGLVNYPLPTLRNVLKPSRYATNLPTKSTRQW